jgi:hypothetical protein
MKLSTVAGTLFFGQNGSDAETEQAMDFSWPMEIAQHVERACASRTAFGMEASRIRSFRLARRGRIRRHWGCLAAELGREKSRRTSHGGGA